MTNVGGEIAGHKYGPALIVLLSRQYNKAMVRVRPPQHILGFARTEKDIGRSGIKRLIQMDSYAGPIIQASFSTVLLSSGRMASRA